MSAIDRLISLAEHLTPSGVIGDGTVAEFHDLARKAKAARFESLAVIEGEPAGRLVCFLERGK